MAALALGFVGTAIGTSIGGSILGVTAATIGGMVGASIGSVIDNAILRSLTPAQRVEGPRLQETAVMSSSEGVAMGRLHGIMRVSGNLIWVTRFKETVTTETETVGGKGGGGTDIETTTYSYSASLAVAFGEGGERTQLGRIWMDGKEVDLSQHNWEFYRGTEDQDPDPTIQGVEGADNTPAFRGTTYIVFEDFELGDYGNRIPQVTAEIINPLITDDPDDISNIARSFCLIPGSGEFVYGTDTYTLQTASDDVVSNHFAGGSFTNQLGDTIATPSHEDGEVEAVTMNLHTNRGETDFVRSMEQLKLFQPNLDAIVLVVGWFGSDLRIDQCEVKPKVEFKDRGGLVTPREWNVAGRNRSSSDIEAIPTDGDGNPYYGGTPSDDVIVEAIQWLKANGIRVIFYPFIFMDVTPDNSLPTPYSDNASTTGQPAFPWRGRITCSPAAGYAGTVDKTAAAATQVNTFFTRTWGINNMIEHYADLCDRAGGVDGFVIGTEMPGMTTIRSNANTYPAVAHLKTLAATVKGIVGGSCDVGYAADWSEYHSHRPADGSGDIYYPMDALWSDANIDFIGIDNYLPLSDWRDGTAHLDYDPDNGVVSPHNLDYLRSNVEGGEGFDWFYASEADRDNQVRTPITDFYGKPWVFRQKDIRSWLTEYHYDRPGGVPSGTPTSYVPGSKPMWFTEFGCPAVDKGTNQPNVFYDPKSSESFFPYYSTGRQDEYIPRVYAEATLTYWRDNPIAGGLLDLDNMFIWCWDSRPYPDYPYRSDVWSDGALWDFGHWMTGRLAYPSLPRLIKEMCEEVNVTDIDTELLNGAQALVRGFYVDSVMAIRDMIASLMTGFQFDSFESQGKIKFVLKSSTALVSIDSQDFVSTESDVTGLSITRAQNTDLPKSVNLDFLDPTTDYEVSSLDAKRHQVDSQEVATVQLPMVLNADYVRALGDSIIHQAWAARETGSVKLPLSLYKLEPGDGIAFPLGSRVMQGRIMGIDVGEQQEAVFQGFDLSMFELPIYPVRQQPALQTFIGGFPALLVLDIPLFSGNEPSHWSPRLASWARPWPGGLSIFEDVSDEGGLPEYVLQTVTRSLDVVGRIYENSVPAMKANVYYPEAEMKVNLFTGGTLPSITKSQLLNGANACAMQNDEGDWEIFQYQDADLQGGGVYILKGLIRGQLGTEWAMNNPMSAGNSFCLLRNQFSSSDNAPYLPLGPSDNGATKTIRYGSASKAPDDDQAYLTKTVTTNAVAQRPYSPVHLKARWNLSVSNDIALSWIRRSRFDGDNWETPELPLNEDNEQYELEILDGSTVVREVTGLTSPAYTYTNAMQVADFGSSQTSSLKFRVYQISANVGRGTPAEETITR